ncbi:MAG: cation transporter, partial [Daejeonella sp.]
MESIVLPVTGMSCAACAGSVESITGSLQGVEKSSVNYANQTLSISYDEEVVDMPEIQKAVQSIGYDLIVDTENADEKQQEVKDNYYKELKHKTIFASVLTVPVVLIGMFFMNIPYG